MKVLEIGNKFCEITNYTTKFREINKIISRKICEILAKSFRGISRNSAEIPRKNCFISSNFVFREIASYPFRGHPTTGVVDTGGKCKKFSIIKVLII
jgi:hypothetical protein